MKLYTFWKNVHARYTFSIQFVQYNQKGPFCFYPVNPHTAKLRTEKYQPKTNIYIKNTFKKCIAKKTKKAHGEKK